MATQRTIATERRRARRKQKLPADAACALCGEQTPEALTLTRRSLLEAHHVAGAVNADDLVVPLCLNHHAIVTEQQRMLGVDLHRSHPRSILEVLVSVLRALGGFLHALGEKMLAWAEQLAALVGALDRDHPAWRELPEAQP